jgi:hypothetical protein
MLEAEMLQPLLLQVREGSPSECETAGAAGRAVDAFLMAYAPTRRRALQDKQYPN